MSKRNGKTTQEGTGNTKGDPKEIGTGVVPSVALKLGVPRTAPDLDLQLASISYDAITGAVDYKVAAQVIAAASARVRLAVAQAKYGQSRPAGIVAGGLLTA